MLRSLGDSFLSLYKAAKKRADHYEPEVKTDLSFGELTAMSVGKKPQEEN
jgi:hypothetical protein